MADFSRFRDQPTPAPRTLLEVFSEVPTEGVLLGDVLAVDQSLAKSGWALFSSDTSSGLHCISLEETGTLRKPADLALEGFAASFARAIVLYDEFVELIKEYDPRYVVHALPPVGRMAHSHESSLVAATTLQIAATQCDVTVLTLGEQKAKKRWTGNGNAKKPEVRKAVQVALPELTEFRLAEAPKLKFNEDIYDAIAIGVTAIEGVHK